MIGKNVTFLPFGMSENVQCDDKKIMGWIQCCIKNGRGRCYFNEIAMNPMLLNK